MKLYNTLSHKVEDFVPENPSLVKIYTCGPTVYSYAHIGNFVSYMYWDLLIRVLRLNGFRERRILNITDVGHLTSDADNGEDKMEKGAKREGKTVWEIADMYTEDFLKNFRALGLIEPGKICRATDYIDADMKLVDKLDEAGYLYDTTDGLYFDTSKFPKYAELARLDIENLRAGARVEFSDEKRNATDFAVWKWVRDGEDHAMQWEYRDRMGYPGWHLECSTIIHEELEEPIDIHCGGIDHIPVHHTNEIAQSECAFGKQLAKFWVHNNFLTINGEKISKSLGNVYYLSDLEEKGFTVADLKTWLYQGHYQAERDFSFEQLEAAHSRLMNYKSFAVLRWQGFELSDFESERAGMMDCLSNNLNTSGALSILDKVCKSEKAPSQKFIEFLDAALGLNLTELTKDLPVELKMKISQRSDAKATHDYEIADKFRDELLAHGVELLDGPEKTIWRYAN